MKKFLNHSFERFLDTPFDFNDATLNSETSPTGSWAFKHI